MIKVSICDDDQGDRLHAEELTREFMQLKHVENVSIDTFDNPTDMLAEIDGGKAFDLILCDIYMPGLLGTEAIQELRDDDMMFAETSDHDQVIHLQNKATVSTRSSSQALFNRLSQDGRFFKAGSSYILNLDNVRSIQGRDVTFVNGEAITVPARSRKELEDAFFDFSFEGI